MARGIVNKQENSAEPLRKLINRRRFVQGLAVCGSVAALDLKTIRASGQAKAQSLPVLSGDRFHLDRYAKCDEDFVLISVADHAALRPTACKSLSRLEMT
jgi:hypothetical protein